MSSSNITSNDREVLKVIDQVTLQPFSVKGTISNGGINVNATATLSGSAIPITGATTAIGVAIVDGSGNQITSFGGGTQYAEEAIVSPATGTVALARYNSTPPTLTNGQLYAPQLDINGNLKVTGTFSSTPLADIAPATQNITVIDSGSATASGANGQNIVTGSATVGSTATFSVASLETVRVQISGTWTGTLASEASIDGGITWVSLGLHQGAYTTSTFTANLVGGANLAGATNYRIRATSVITGTATIKVIESVNTASVYVANAAPSGNVISLLNSTTTPLAIGATYTGIGEDVNNFSEMRISVIANVASATNGLSIQQSTDNTNWDITDTYTIDAGVARTYVVPRQARYYRVVFTNGGNIQASFRLQSILNRTATVGSSQRTQDAYSNENDLEQSWTFGSFFNGTTWDRFRGDITNGLDTDVTRVIPGTAATNLGKAEDAAHTTGDVGVMSLGIRNDTVADVTSASGDYSQLSTDLKGRLISVGAPRALKTTQQTTITSSTTETTVLSAVTSTFLDVYGVILVNTSPTACDVTFKDSTAGTTRFNIYVPAGDTRGFMLPMDAAHNQTAVNNNWTATCGSSVTSIKITMFAVRNV